MMVDGWKKERKEIATIVDDEKLNGSDVDSEPSYENEAKVGLDVESRLQAAIDLETSAQGLKSFEWMTTSHARQLGRFAREDRDQNMKRSKLTFVPVPKMDPKIMMSQSWDGLLGCDDSVHESCQKYETASVQSIESSIRPVKSKGKRRWIPFKMGGKENGEQFEVEIDDQCFQETDCRDNDSFDDCEENPSESENHVSESCSPEVNNSYPADVKEPSILLSNALDRRVESESESSFQKPIENDENASLQSIESSIRPSKMKEKMRWLFRKDNVRGNVKVEVHDHIPPETECRDKEESTKIRTESENQCRESCSSDGNLCNPPIVNYRSTLTSNNVDDHEVSNRSLLESHQDETESIQSIESTIRADKSKKKRRWFPFKRGGNIDVEIHDHSTPQTEHRNTESSDVSDKNGTEPHNQWQESYIPSENVSNPRTEKQPAIVPSNSCEGGLRRKNSFQESSQLDEDASIQSIEICEGKSKQKRNWLFRGKENVAGNVEIDIQDHYFTESECRYNESFEADKNCIESDDQERESCSINEKLSTPSTDKDPAIMSSWDDDSGSTGSFQDSCQKDDAIVSITPIESPSREDTSKQTRRWPLFRKRGKENEEARSSPKKSFFSGSKLNTSFESFDFDRFKITVLTRQASK